MTKDKLLKLYNKFKDEEIDISVIRKLRNCTNKDIDINNELKIRQNKQKSL